MSDASDLAIALNARLGEVVEGLTSGPADIVAEMDAAHERSMRDAQRAIEEGAEKRERQREAAEERERQMVAAMQAMREAAERDEERERAAEARAVASGAREAKMLRLAVAGVTFGALAFGASVVSIFAG